MVQKSKEGEMMKWLGNLNSIATNGQPGTCPYCESENVNYILKIVDEKSKMGYGAIWCNDCKKAFHISRIKVDEGIIKEIPSDLEFD